MARTDLFESPDYFQLDELLTDEHKLIRTSVRGLGEERIKPDHTKITPKRLNFQNSC